MKNLFIAMATLINSSEVSKATASTQESMPSFVLPHGTAPATQVQLGQFATPYQYVLTTEQSFRSGQ